MPLIPFIPVFKQGDVLDALPVKITEDWYREWNETLSLVVAYSEQGERGENARTCGGLSRSGTPVAPGKSGVDGTSLAALRGA
jgi:hypothetical protein